MCQECLLSAPSATEQWLLMSMSAGILTFNSQISSIMKLNQQPFKNTYGTPAWNLKHFPRWWDCWRTQLHKKVINCLKVVKTLVLTSYSVTLEWFTYVSLKKIFMSSPPDNSQGITTFLCMLQGCLHMLKETLEDREEYPSGSKIGAAVFCMFKIYLWKFVWEFAIFSANEWKTAEQTYKKITNSTLPPLLKWARELGSLSNPVHFRVCEILSSLVSCCFWRNYLIWDYLRSVLWVVLIPSD